MNPGPRLVEQPASPFDRIEDILAHGLHAYLTGFLERVNDLGGRISQDFLVPLQAA